jgi:AcrR family transcriptional regulator
LLDAAWAELSERGYADFTLDGVAERAGTSTPVLYRRWADKAQLVEAAVAHASAREPFELPDTGSLRDDLIGTMTLANQTRADLMAVAAVQLGLYYREAGSSLAQLRAQELEGRRSRVEILLHRAVARGEVDEHVLTPRIIALPFDLFRHEVLTTLQPVPAKTIEEIVDDIFLPLLRRL